MALAPSMERTKRASAFASFFAPSLFLGACGGAPSTDDMQRFDPPSPRAPSTLEERPAFPQVADPRSEEAPRFLVVDEAKIPDGYTKVPTGHYVHHSCVHHLEDGARLEGRDTITRDGQIIGHIPKCPYQMLVTSARAASGETAQDAQLLQQAPEHAEQPQQSETVFGWQAYVTGNATTANGASPWFDYMFGYWSVPDNPPANGALLYYFISMQNAAKTIIIQPVLQWGANDHFGGNYWSIASWKVDGFWGTAVFSNPYVVAPGTPLVGMIHGSACTPNGRCVWDIYLNGTDFSNNTVQSILSTYIPEASFTNAQKAVMEVKLLNGCNQYPTNNGLRFYNVTTFQEAPAGRYTDTTSSIAWQGMLGNGTPLCDRNVITNFLGKPKDALLLWTWWAQN